ncbi:hypothetical protein QJQ45_003841 [Haematococcus lacustris]|nr:hypothetical protein QJQ45_003841 [Haematococcus lacustris]
MAATREQKYNGKNTDTSVVMEKVQDSKFTATWDFEFDEGKAYCKRCPHGVNNAGASVNNMTQTDQQRCTAKPPVVGKRRIDEDNFGPVPLQERNLSQDMLRAVRRRLGLFLVTSRTPFRQADNVHLQAMFNLLGVDLRKEKYYRTTQLEELHEEVKEVTMKEVGKLLKVVELERLADISVRRGFWDFTARQYFPLFSEAATRLLSMHVTTAAAERNWSAWGLTYEAGRAQLGIEKAEKMIYINANIPKSATDDPFELVARGITA